jgi:hypothetical protein
MPRLRPAQAFRVPEGSPFPADKPANGAVQPCTKPMVLTSGSATGANPPPKKPCDVATITLNLTSDGKTIAKTGSSKQASGPLTGVGDEINALLAGHAVVIHRAIPSTIMTNQLTAAGTTVSFPVAGKASASASMKSTCGKHPTITESPEPSEPAKKGALSVSTTKWEVSDFGQMIFKGKSWRDLFYGDRSKVTYEATSCGAPASGNATTSLKAVAQIAIADEWNITFASSKGIEIKFSSNVTHEKENSYGSGYRGTYNSTTQTLGGSLTTPGIERSSQIKTSTSQDNYNRTQNIGGGYRLDTDYRSTTQSYEKEFKSKEEFMANGQPKMLSDAQESLTLEIKRNGTTVFSIDEIKESWKKLTEEIKSISDRVARITDLLERGARIAFPMSLSFDLAFALTLLKGSINARIWPDKAKVLQGGTYYIEQRQSQFQVGVSLLVAQLKIDPKIEAQASVVSKYIASIGIVIEGSIGGSVSVNFNVDTGTTSYIVQAHGRIPMSISASATGYAASFYVTAQGSVTSAMNYTWGAEYRPLELSAARHHLTNDQLSCELVVKRGNKIAEYFGFGEATEWFKWPKDGPFIWIEAGAMQQSW